MDFLNILDEHKENLPDGFYLMACDTAKAAWERDIYKKQVTRLVSSVVDWEEAYAKQHTEAAFVLQVLNKSIDLNRELTNEVHVARMHTFFLFAFMWLLLIALLSGVTKNATDELMNAMQLTNNERNEKCNY